MHKAHFAHGSMDQARQIKNNNGQLKVNKSNLRGSFGRRQNFFKLHKVNIFGGLTYIFCDFGRALYTAQLFL
jgi:hypothetical protein|tara:strand:- start:1551 stop:1766 length:216 start_codon:yes stop_codon:yes gene_type:complete